MTPTKTQTRVSPYWRSLDELEQTPEFLEFVHREFPQAADEIPAGVNRRRWMQIMSASFALAAAQGCRWKTETILPLADRPEGYVPGTISKFATNIEWAGAPRHLLVSCYDGRPIKVDGNPEHPASRGGTDSVTQALTLSLYDPDRQDRPILRGESASTEPPTWDDVKEALGKLAEGLAESSGARLAVLMQPTSSLSLTAALKGLFEKFPEASLVHYAPLSRENELAGAQQAFGQRVRTRYQLKDADVIATFDCDLLKDLPESVAMARDYADRRDPTGAMNRLYCVESQFTITGGMADHRFPLKSSAMVGALAELLEMIEAGEAPEVEGKADATAPTRKEYLSALAGDLLSAKGRSVVCVGAGQPPVAHALAHKINDALGNAGKTVLYAPEPKAAKEPISLRQLAGKIASREIDSVLILGGNPIYDAPVDLEFAARLAEVSTSIHLSPYDDETSRNCTWSLPETHPFESWGDARAWDGTIGVAQPLIDPVLDARSALEVINMLAGNDAEPMQFVADAVSEAAGEMNAEAWEKLLHDGLLQGSGFKPDNNLSVQDFPVEPGKAPELEVVLTPGDTVYDGRLANNGWMQETPNPITKLTWDNAALINPDTAAGMNLGQGDMIEITLEREIGAEKVKPKIKLPVFLQPGQAKGSIGVALGYGRTAAGRVGGLLDEDGDPVQGLFPNGVLATWFPVAAAPVGVDAYPLRTLDAMTILPQGTVSVTAAGGSYKLATTQDHHAIDVGGMEELTKRSEELVREASHEHYQEHNDFAQHYGHHIETENLWEEPTYNRGSKEGNAWGMAIDLNKCIGCTACHVACQAENNVPVVGKDMVSRGREMHWIRIDRYFRSDDGKFADNPTVVHQPMTCQQCETAPCEQVCPVAATIHSAEGLNDMTYNRCIGTRYCANNCPFKVRRFNYFHYNWELERNDWPAGKLNEPTVNANRELQRLVLNPEVTVRHRGVMEKCTYCTQRISAARIEAKVEARTIRDGDIVTACQQACPTGAIVFGDINDKSSQVAKAHADSRCYGLLDGLHLRPRTQYLARIRNPHPALKKYGPNDPPVAHHGEHGAEHGGAEHHEEHNESPEHEDSSAHEA